MTASRGSSTHPVGEVRHGQLITTYGPGAMVDLPDRSVVVGGLNLWHYSRDDDSCTIDEPRLIAKLRGLLNVGTLQLKRPPSEDDNFAQKFKSSSGIRSPQFPLWFVAQPRDQPFPPYTDEKGKRYRTRPLIHKDRLVDESYAWRPAGGKPQKLDVVPVRFVQCCPNGHLSDIDWDRFAHEGARSRCQEGLWLDEAGAGNDFNEIYVRCSGCGKRQALASTKSEDGKKSLLGQCLGSRPWLGNFSAEASCTDEHNKPRYNRLLVRSASNAYFPEVVGAISIPAAEDPLRQLIITHLSDFQPYTSAEKLALAIELEMLKTSLLEPLRGRDPEEVMNILEAVRGHKDAPVAKQPALKEQEIKALYAPSGSLGSKDPASTFHAEILPLSGKPTWFTNRFDRVLKVHRLREVMALIGFARLEPIVKGVDGDLIDQHGVGATRAAINSKELDWVPAIENFGEGVFLGVSAKALKDWCNSDGVKQHSSKHSGACKLWNRDHGLKPDEFAWPGAPYLMLHSLAHLLITTAALECGYGASAIKERIYSFGELGSGILLYTSGSGSEGTLGGLVSLADRIDQLVADALEHGRLCSNDPFCSMHHPENDLEKRYSHGAACHGCLLIAETSCEQGNQFLDRAFVVPTLEVGDAAFFPDPLP
jgi:hypothetical protein